MNTTPFEIKNKERQDDPPSPFVPLRRVSRRQVGEFAYDGYEEEVCALTSCAFQVEDRAAAERADWSDFYPLHFFEGFSRQGRYTLSDEVLQGDPEIKGVSLVLVSQSVGDLPEEWHLHQDFVISLRLRREKDTWVAPAEGYREVARLTRNGCGTPVGLDVARDFLQDYLTARGMGLLLIDLRKQRTVVGTEPVLPWPDGCTQVQLAPNELFRGAFRAIREGTGQPFGNDDLRPSLHLEAASTGPVTPGERAYLVDTECTRTEWLPPSGFSPRLRLDPETERLVYHTGSSGIPQPLEPELYGDQLFFSPGVVQAMLHCREGQLSWSSRDTGRLQAAPGHGLPFRLNDLGLLVVLDQDFASLPTWQQRILVNHSTSPRGGMDPEVQHAQELAPPVGTLAPPVGTLAAEQRLTAALERLRQELVWNLGLPFPKMPGKVTQALRDCHRFRVLQGEDLIQLAQDVTRSVFDHLNFYLQFPHEPVLFPEGPEAAARVAFHGALTTMVGVETAQALMAPFALLAGLRPGRANGADDSMTDDLQIIGIRQDMPLIQQGEWLLEWTAGVMEKVTQAIAEQRERPPSIRA